MENNYFEILEQLENNPEILEMKQYKHHIHTTTFDHCDRVAIYSYLVASKLHIKVDEESLVRGALLHDYYLYEAKNSVFSAYKHGTQHPELALKNACEIFDLNEKEKNIIRAHMWPLTITHYPHSKEAWLVCLADKICAFQEFTGWKMN